MEDGTRRWEKGPMGVKLGDVRRNSGERRAGFLLMEFEKEGHCSGGQEATF